MGIKSDEVYINHILTEIRFIKKQIHNLDFEDFIEDEILNRATMLFTELMRILMTLITIGTHQFLRPINIERGLRRSVINYLKKKKLKDIDIIFLH